MLASPKHRALLIALGREVEAIGVTSGVKLEAFDGFDPAAFLPGASLAAANASLDALVAFNRRSAKTHSGIWRDLAVRKRKTEVDFQMGPIVTTGAKHKMAAPITARMIELIHDIENGKRPLAWSTLDTLGEVLPKGSAA